MNWNTLCPSTLRPIALFYVKHVYATYVCTAFIYRDHTFDTALLFTPDVAVGTLGAAYVWISKVIYIIRADRFNASSFNILLPSGLWFYVCALTR